MMTRVPDVTQILPLFLRRRQGQVVPVWLTAGEVARAVSCEVGTVGNVLAHLKVKGLEIVEDTKSRAVGMSSTWALTPRGEHLARQYRAAQQQEAIHAPAR